MKENWWKLDGADGICITWRSRGCCRRVWCAAVCWAEWWCGRKIFSRCRRTCPVSRCPPTFLCWGSTSPWDRWSADDGPATAAGSSNPSSNPAITIITHFIRQKNFRVIFNSNFIQNDRQFSVWGLNSYEKRFHFAWIRTRVSALASSQRWPLGHPDLIFEKLIIIWTCSHPMGSNDYIIMLI